MGKEKHPTRLVAYKLPEEVVNLRRQKAKASARKKGRKPTKEYLNWLEFGYYITNVPSEMLSAEVIGTIYRIRWQIELIFKSWKSLLNIHVLKGTVQQRIKSYVYGRLITITVMTMIYSFACWYASKKHCREASAHKIFNWLKRLNRLGKAIFKNNIKSLLDELMQNILINCKQKRKRKTTLELIELNIPYMESFDQNQVDNIISGS